MAKQMKRTMRGRAIDFAELELRNQDVIAVGNMNEPEKVLTTENSTVASGTRRPNNLPRNQIEKVPRINPVVSNKAPTEVLETVKKTAKKKAPKKNATAVTDSAEVK